jgi:hypothetical protein
MLARTEVDLVEGHARGFHERLGILCNKFGELRIGGRLRWNQVFGQKGHLLDQALANLAVVVVEAERERFAVQYFFTDLWLDELIDLRLARRLTVEHRHGLRQTCDLLGRNDDSP